MRFTALFLIALVCLSSVSAVSLRKNTVTSQTKYIIERLRLLGKHSPIVGKITAAIELNLTQNSKIAEIISLVQEVLDQSEASLEELTAFWANLSSQLTATIAKAESDLVELNADQVATEESIANVTAQIAGLEAQIQSLVEELASLDVRESVVRQARANDEAAYAKRQERDANAIEALNAIIPALKNLLARGNSFLQVSKADVARALSKIPKSNPIQALVQLSTRFDEERLRNIIAKLELILSSVIKSSEDDLSGEDSSRQHFENLIAQIESVRENRQLALARAERELEDAQTTLEELEQHLARVQNTIVETQALKDHTEAVLSEQTVIYTQRISDARAAVDGIQQALVVLQQHANITESAEDNVANNNSDLENGLVQ